MAAELEVEEDRGITYLTLANPSKHNALTANMVQDLIKFLDKIPEGTQVLVISGAGKSFCAGADVSQLANNPDYLDNIQLLMKKLEEVPIPVIASLQGATIGAGVQLAMCADVRIMDSESFIAIPAVKLGIALDSWSIRKLASLLGTSLAKYLLMSGSRISAQRCLTAGFAAEIGTLSMATNLAKELINFSENSLEHIKIILNADHARDLMSPNEALAQYRTWNNFNNGSK